MSIEVYLTPPEAVAQALSDGIASFNRSAIPDPEPNEDEVRFHVVASSDTNRVVGGLRGTCYWNTLHIELLYGTNNHHICESIYKGFARAMRIACDIDPRKGGAIPSTKGQLGG